MNFRIGVLVSGLLGEVILNMLLRSGNVIDFICTDKKSNGIINLAKEYGIPLFIGNPRSMLMDKFLLDKKIDLLLSINYLYLIEKNLITFPELFSVNLHGSLLPKNRGRTPHVWAIINGEKKTGVTAHLIDEGCDTGKIILQKEILIDERDTGGTILEKFQIVYPEIVSELIERIKIGNYTLKSQNEALATYNVKRTEADGEINWDWESERIRNWVRAQADPYPGAFTFMDSVKVIVDEISIVEFKFETVLNGTVLSSNPIVVKTVDGAVQLTKIRTDIQVDIGKKLGNL